jgi:Zn-dependent peptidase ImmA (M78 family)
MTVILQKKANLFRERNGISGSEAIRIKSLLLKLNVFTLFKPLTEGFSGMSLKINDNSRFILVNSSHSIGRQHFTIAHELYHLYIQGTFEIHQCITGLFDPKNKEEYNADYFASCLLMPESGIQEMIPDEELKKNKISIQTVIKLEQYFSVSHSSILVRLRMLGLVDNKTFEYLKTFKATETAQKYGYDTSLYKEGNHNAVVGDYGEKAKRLFDKEKISEGHYLELMQLIGIDITNPERGNEN